MIADYGTSNKDLRKENEIIVKLWYLVSVIVFDMKLLATFQATAGTAVVKESYSEK